MDRKIGSSGEIKPLTGLRGVAALLVIIAHFSLWTAPVPISNVPQDVLRYARVADIGMVIFFVLSGYVIALSYSSWEWGKRPSFCLTRFFFYRFARLYPAFVLFAILVLLRTPSLAVPMDGRKLGILVPHLLLWQSWAPVKYGGHLAVDSPFSVSWSLSTECALYAFFGIGAILAAKVPAIRHKTIALSTFFAATSLIVLSTLWSGRSHFSPDGWSESEWQRWLFYISPYYVVIEFMLGVAAFRLSRSEALWSVRLRALAGVAGPTGLVVVYLLGVYDIMNTGGHAYNILAVLSVACILLGATGDGPVNRILGCRALVSLGTISYSLYLFHFLIPGAVVGPGFSEFAGPVPTYFLLNFCISIVLTIALAAGIYRLVELPARKQVRVLADRVLGIQRATRLESSDGSREIGTARF